MAAKPLADATRESVNERRRDGDLSAGQATELVQVLSTRQMALQREEQTTSTVSEVEVTRH